ncbi:MAG: PpiC-type peptidyl-prolyl cis-trans isomerase, partial [Akkermansiaceae bacterium]|nr:PpiC-type peptidyl-prolyl cis-trans isomerase [Akkermansiaceae bacterium]
MPRVNGEIIDPGLIEEAFSRLKAEAEMLSQVSCCERDPEFRLLAEEEVIDGILLSQEAERSVPLPMPSEIREAFEETLRLWREHGASWELIESRKGELKEDSIAKLRMERFTQRLWGSLPALTEADLREWYQANLARFRTPPAARVVHLVRFPQTEDPWEDYAAMLEWRLQALAGEDFEALAKAHTAKRDGQTDLGWVEQERLLNPFEVMLFS